MKNTNEMVAFDEIEDIEEIVETGKNNGTKTLVGVGVGIAIFVLGALVHKYAKPIARKVKSKFKKKNETDESDIIEGGYVYAEPGMYSNVALLDIASMHPSSIVAEELFGPEYTKEN